MKNPARENIARSARVETSASFQWTEQVGPVAGARESSWSQGPGGAEPGWIQLSWDAPVNLREIVVHQKTSEIAALTVSLRGPGTDGWETVGRLDGKGRRLARTVPCVFSERAVTGVRVEGVSGQASIRSIEAFAAALPPVTTLASDANGTFIGMVSDGYGFSPMNGALVSLRGRAASGVWKASVKSDDAGLFFLPMPVGLAGTVQVVTEAGHHAVKSTVRAEDFQYGLTPRSHGEKALPLNDGWRFSCDPPPGFQDPGFDDRAWSPINVPAHFIMEGFDSLDGIGGYRLRFTAPESAGRLKLLFEGVYSGAEVWLNGARIAYHEGGALPFEVDVTDTARRGRNLLALRVTEHTVTSDRLDRMSFYANFPLAGIMRGVSLVSRPCAHVGAISIETVFDRRWEDATISARVGLVNESSEHAEISLSARLENPKGVLVPHEMAPRDVAAAAWGRVDVDLAIPVTRPLKWDAEHPNLYLLTLELRQGGRLVQRLRQRIGFRQTDIDGSRILINGRPVKIRGTCRHDAHPLMGRAITPELARKDIEMIKSANLNSVRTSHYPPVSAVLDHADEIGIYVEDEGSFCWAEDTDDLRLTPRIMQMNAELLARDRNHPSVFMWSVCNESNFGYGFRCSHAWVRAADPRRPTSAATGADLEIATLHNPISIARIRKQESTTAPLLFDEAWCVYQGIFGDIAEMWVDPGIRDYYAQPLPGIYEAMMKSRVTQGSQIWCWGDDIFCVPHRGLEYGRGMTKSHFIEHAYQLPDRGLCGDAPWGVVDGWRRPKPEYWIVRKLFSPVRVRETRLMPAKDGTLRIPVRNDFDFTDLSELSFSWKLGSETGTARAAARPHATGALLITPKRRPTAGAALALTVRDGAGRVLDEYLVPVGAAAPRAARQTSPHGAARSPVAVREENSLSTRSVQVVNNVFDMSFAIQDPAYYDHGGGHLRRCVAYGRPILLEAPQVHVLPTGAPTRPAPDRLSWQVRSLASERRGNAVVVRIAGAYDLFDAEYLWIIAPDGRITVESRATWKGEQMRAREIGVRFSVPLPCDCLAWSRNAEWAVYPDDHIGRPRGRARAFASHGAGVPPRWPWGEDQTPMGTNDFRGTKRHIRQASIGYEQGPGVVILSDGTQHVRAMVETDRISVHVLDWYGGTATRLEEWRLNYGDGRLLERGQVLETTLRLQLVPRVDVT
jgi:beta-galactosidase